MKKLIAVALGVTVLASTAAYAGPNGGKQYVLEDGTVHSNPGEMFQHLRTRDNGYAAGNPKDVVEAYPTEFENVGDLIQQKRVEDN
jgi:hypothetical protein